MHELLHILGLCSDNFSHMDLTDYIVANYRNISFINTDILKHYVIKLKQHITIS